MAWYHHQLLVSVESMFGIPFVSYVFSFFLFISCLGSFFGSDLYGINVRPVAPFGSVSRKPYVDPALIHRCLPDELLYEVMFMV